jgi:chromosome segregation ATPase
MAFEQKGWDRDLREQMIAEAAYYRAERRGFADGDALRDWYEAAAEVDARLRRLQEERLVQRVAEVVAAASSKLTALRRKVARVSSEARNEWQKDVDRLATLRDALEPKLTELRERGEQASQSLRAEAEKIRAEAAALMQRLGGKTQH